MKVTATSAPETPAPRGKFQVITGELKTLQEYGEALDSLPSSLDVDMAATFAAFYRAGRLDERAALLGGTGTRRPRRPRRSIPHSRAGSRSGHLSVVPDGRPS